MNAQDIASQQAEPASDAQTLLPAPETKLLAPPASEDVSDHDFEEVVRGALEAVGGTLLFKMKVDADGGAQHAAAAAVGLGEERQFLLLTLPAHGGGRLKVETASHSESPLARIAESYAGLMDVLKAAA
jgi:hypothetical protein